MKICPECRAVYHEAAPVCPVDGASLLDLAPDDPRCGTVIDDQYLMLGRLGAGGMGTVYRAWQFSTNRVVALKLLAEGINENPTAIERFMREARMTAGLSSPHVVRVYDFGQLEGGTVYMAMELIDGTALDAMIHGPMPPARAIELVRQVCLALEEAHGQGLVHRDLKPGNIIVRQLADGGDFAQVLDFGIAKVLDETQTALTHESQNPGTPAYMSPEQARNEPVGPATDLYALSVIFFEMLVGERPFTGTSAMSVLLQHVQATPPSLKARLPDLAGVEALDAVLQQGLAKQVADRYASAEALRADLDRLKTGAAPEALTHPALKPTRGFGWNMQALGCSVQLAVAVGALAFFVVPAMRDDAPTSGRFDDVVQGEPQGITAPNAQPATAPSAPPLIEEDAEDDGDRERETKDTPQKLEGVGRVSTEDGGGASAGAHGRTPERGPAKVVAHDQSAQQPPTLTKKRERARRDVIEDAKQKSAPKETADRVIAKPAVVPLAVSPPDDDKRAAHDLPPPGSAPPPPPPPPATPAELTRLLRAEAPKIRATCGPGIWPLQLLIDVEGRVQTVRITQPGRAAHAQARCVLEAVRALTFPAPARPVPLRVTL